MNIEFNTKYNVGDKLYKIQNNTFACFYISKINIECKISQGNITKEIKYDVCNALGQLIAPKTSEEIEDNYYKSKQEILKQLISEM